MTWQELEERIKYMSPRARTQEVRFVEPYDESTGYPVKLMRADEDIICDGKVFIKAGERFLA